ncbi:MAG: tetratricopeptide repeat protein [Gemmatimonadota bacterium]
MTPGGIDPKRWKELEPLLDQALELEPEKRSGYLDTACGADAALRSEVNRLIVSCERARRLLETPAVDLFSTLLSESSVPDARLGPYRLVGVAGRGGMGTVFLAERDDDQYRKRVALKLVRPGLALDPHLVRRFREERQILANLDHPGIARLVDGGVTGDGLPWLAMEYVEGKRIDHYSDERRLGVVERLELFLQVCDAVQYAHRNLIVHRDLKPSNIFVTAEGRVMLLDFGIAKLLATAEAAGEGPPLTMTGLQLMTPEYASPEQLRGAAISTASDVYSLGVLLYELLTGQRPFPAAGLSRAEVERAILEEEPERPSSAVRHGDERLALARSATRERLARRLKGDLDTIVLTALHKEPERRYPSAEGLGADIRWHLDSRPIAARPDTRRYRAAKFVRRHPIGVTAIAGFVALLAGFSAVTTIQSERTARERDKAERLAGFLTGLLGSPDPWYGRGGSVTVRELLDDAVARLKEEPAMEPEVRAQLFYVIAEAYWGLSLYEEARRTLEASIYHQRRTLGDKAQVEGSQTLLAMTLHSMDDFAAAESIARLSVASKRKRLGDGHVELAPSLVVLAEILRSVGRDDEAETYLREAIEIRRAERPFQPTRLALAVNMLGHVYLERGDHARAEALYRQVLELRRGALGENHPDVGLAYVNLARARHELGDTTAAALMRRGMEIKRPAFPEGHPEFAMDMTHLADILADRGELASAESLYAEALSIQTRALGPAHSTNGSVLTGLGRVRLERGDPFAAESLLREAVTVLSKEPPGRRWPRAEAEILRGKALAAQGRPAEAEVLLLRGLATLRKDLGDDHPRTIAARDALAEFHRARRLDAPDPYRSWIPANLSSGDTSSR